LSFPLVPTLLIENVPEVEQDVNKKYQTVSRAGHNSQTDDVMSQSTGTRCVTLS
jgi:hypothetical protein